ncbi:MAG: substrate-binding domain-containing protein [Lachnospiraceae bacterium]|nr:substrate-binding domain-containing protein [Lachnospiraceae bacterium]
MNVLKKNPRLLVVLALVLIFLITAMYQIMGRGSKDSARKNVSLIVYGDDSERWESMRQGAGLACEEKEYDLSLITMLTENDASEQMEIIDREIDDGSDALIIAACNSSVIRDYINDKNLRIPVVFVETVEGLQSGMKDIAASDYEMGYKLGEEIAANESDIVTVAIISENTKRDSVKLREQGLRDALEGKVGKMIDWSRNDYEKNVNTRVFIQRAIVSEATDVIVTFDNSATDALLDALENLNKQSKVYAVSTSNKAVYNLYGGEIKALEYTDEFSMGYLAAMYALDERSAEKKYSKEIPEYRLVRKENMYDENNQALLFPFVN